MKSVSKKAKRRMFLLFIVLVAVISAVMGSAIKDWKQIYSNKKAYKELTTEYRKLLDNEKSLEAEVAKFQDPGYVARYAREKFLYSLPGEMIIRIPKNIPGE